MLRSLRFSLRRLRNSSGFAVTAILTLALGIGATTAIFSILDAVLLRPLPFPHPDRLVAIASMPDETVSIPTTQDWQARGNSFQSIGAYRGWSPTVRTSQGTHVGNVVEVSQNFFSTLGANFALGGDLPQTGNERDCTGQAIVSAGFWKRLSGGSVSGCSIYRASLPLRPPTIRHSGTLSIALTSAPIRIPSAASSMSR